MSKRTVVPLIAILVGGLLGIAALYTLMRRPQVGAAADPLSRIPAQCDLVVVVPEPARLGEGLARLPKLRLAQIGASLAGYGDADAFVADLAREAGFDVRSRESMRNAGLDPARPLAVSLARGAPLLVLPEADGAKLEALVVRHAENRLGARKRAQVAAGARQVTTLSVEGQPSPMLAFAHSDGFLVLSTGSAAAQAVGAALAQAPESSLARDARFVELRGNLVGSDAFAFACPGSPTTTSMNLPYGAAAGLKLADGEVKVTFDVPLSDDTAKALESLSKPAGGDLVARLDPAAFLVARFGGDPSWLKPYARDLIPRMFAGAIREAKLDIGEEILGNLQPGMALTLSLAPSAQLGTVPEFDPRRTNPFRYVHLQALGRVRDAPRAQETLGKVEAVAPRFGSTLEQREIAGVKVYTTTYRLGEGASIAFKDNYVAVSGGASQMDTLLGRIGGSDAPLELKQAGAREALEKSGFFLFLDVSRLTTSVRALPDSAYGIGGFAIKAAVSRWLDAVEEITSLRASGRLEGRVLRGELALTLQPVQPTAQKEPGR